MKKTVHIDTATGLLTARLYYPPDRKGSYPALLYLHGWTSNQDRNTQYVEAISEVGFICMTLDLPGHGKSEGDINTITRGEFLSSVMAAYDTLSELPEVNGRISAIGSSFGAYLAVLLADKRQLRNLALRVPANYPDGGFDEPHAKFANRVETRQWREDALTPDDNLALKAVNRFGGNILIIESENDDLVPHQAIENYKNAVADKNRLTHVVMKGAPHSLSEPEHLVRCQQILTDWFKGKV